VSPYDALEGTSSNDASEYLRISPERLSAISKPPQQQKKEKPRFSHTCTRCGKVWDMPIQLDTSRPVYCSECMEILREERKTKKNVMKVARVSLLREDGAPGAVQQGNGKQQPQTGKDSTLRSSSNSPRIVGERKSLPPAPLPSQRGTVTVVRDAEPTKRLSLLEELERAKGRPIETNKRSLDGSSGSSGKRKRQRRPQGGTGGASNGLPVHMDDEGLPVFERAAPTPTEPRSATVFRKTVSSVRPQSPADRDAATPLKPGERVSFDDEA
jgi:CxxC-x17-CxxC domain-containing protein